MQQYYRQQDAVIQLANRQDLMSQLISPQCILPLRRDWEGIGEGLTGKGPEHIKTILNTWPFLAILGPPGTGKTTLIAHAILESFKRDSGLRILVTAQSHYALDNLAKRILKLLKEHNILNRLSVLRIASRMGRDKVDRAIKPYLIDQVTERTIRREKEFSFGSFNHEQLPKAARDVLSKWQSTMHEQTLDVEHKLLTGVNLLFATSGSSTDNQLRMNIGQKKFDWVIIDEAAKAWTTELLVPMTKGIRWTLVGDHKQLSAFNLEAMTKLLNHAQAMEDIELADFKNNHDSLLKSWNFFESLFDENILSQSSTDENTETRNKSVYGSAGNSITQSGLRKPLLFLNHQYRMSMGIHELVSNIFYQGNLNPGELVMNPDYCHNLKHPDFLRGRDLIWLDTGSLGEVAEEDGQKRFNVCEAQIVNRLLEIMNPQPNPEQLALLSPYRAQINEMSRHLTSNFHTSLSTVDAFQGQEADIAIISLVRNNRAPIDQQLLRLGFLTKPNRLNVLFSRARLLLVVVGAFAHFESAKETFWSDLCRLVEVNGNRIDVDKALPNFKPEMIKQ